MVSAKKARILQSVSQKSISATSIIKEKLSIISKVEGKTITLPETPQKVNFPTKHETETLSVSLSACIESFENISVSYNSLASDIEGLKSQFDRLKVLLVENTLSFAANTQFEKLATLNLMKFKLFIQELEKVLSRKKA